MKPPAAPAVAKAKGTVPCQYSAVLNVERTQTSFSGNASPYSTGLPGASLTSTSVDPQIQSSQLLWDEVCHIGIFQKLRVYALYSFMLQEELMFDDFANPPKGKGKEKDVGKRRAYVRVVTNLGGGALNLELYCEKVCPIILECSTCSQYKCEGTENLL